MKTEGRQKAAIAGEPLVDAWLEVQASGTTMTGNKIHSSVA